MVFIDYIEKHIAKYHPKHLEGYQKGWLTIKEIKIGPGKILQIYSDTDGLICTLPSF